MLGPPKLENGDQVMISVSHSGVKVFKMKLAGMIPAAILWESRSISTNESQTNTRLTHDRQAHRLSQRR
jgi:hypothetical protein